MGLFMVCLLSKGTQALPNKQTLPLSHNIFFLQGI
jgi:hypothetical protein